MIPLTEQQIRDIWVEHGCDGEDAEGFARAIEAAHGIRMTKDNASGAGMEPSNVPDWRELSRRLYVELFHCNRQMTTERRKWTAGSCVLNALRDAKDALEAFPEGTDATRLLAESQAHNAKLEAQVERLRELVLTCATRLEFADTMLTAAAGEPTPDNFKYSRDCAEAAKRCGMTAEEARAALKP